jgi:deoxyribonuclease-4
MKDKLIIKFGPAGLGPIKTAVQMLEHYSKLGLRACEIAFTYGIYINKEEDMIAIKSASSKLGMRLSIHAPYWINLNSKEEVKIRQSKERILKCCEVGEKLGAYRVVFHAGFYSGMDEEESYENIKNAILEMQKEIKKNKWKIKLAPETMGKVNVFGSIEQISRLVKDTGCGFCIDFAHILARDKSVDYSRIKLLFNKQSNWHCHFSGIEYGEKGEKRHIKTSNEDWKQLISNLPKNKEIVIINESPNMIEDCVEGLRISKKY